MLERLDYWVSGICSVIGAAIMYLYGDINTLCVCLFGFITLDYLTGVLVAIGNKKLSSAVGFKGIAKKTFIVLMVGAAHLVDRTLNLATVGQSMVCCFYIANEGISILENASKLGLPVPNKLIKLLLQVKRSGGNNATPEQIEEAKTEEVDDDDSELQKVGETEQLQGEFQEESEIN